MNDDNQTIKQDDTQIAPVDEANPVVEEPEATIPAGGAEENEVKSEEVAKLDEPEATGAVESTQKKEVLAESDSQQTDSEAQSETTEQEVIKPSDASAVDEPSNTTDTPTVPAEPVVPDVPGSHWYVVHTYSGHENRVAAALKQRVESEHLENKILDVLVPTQEKIEIRSGKKENIKEKIFPGYILVRMVLDDISWLAVRTTQGVTSFVGMSNKPTAIPDSEVKSIVSYMTQGAQPTYKTTFSENDTVKIIDGPFAEFIGKVESVDKERGKIKVLVSIFGRETPVELDFLQVAKL